MKKLALNTTLAAIAAAAPFSAMAHQEGDILLRFGATTVAPDSDSDRIVLPTEPETVLRGVDVDDNTQLGIIPVWMVTEDFGLELLAATPFEHDIDIKGTGLSAGNTKYLPPTLSLQWYPRGGKDGWQPYIGVGLNYTHFFNEEVDSDLEGALGAILGAESVDFELNDSYGLAAQAGIDIPFGEKWHFNAGVWYNDIETEATVKTDVGNVKFDFTIDPWVYNIGLAYKF